MRGGSGSVSGMNSGSDGLNSEAKMQGGAAGTGSSTGDSALKAFTDGISGTGSGGEVWIDAGSTGLNWGAAGRGSDVATGSSTGSGAVNRGTKAFASTGVGSSSTGAINSVVIAVLSGSGALNSPVYKCSGSEETDKSSTGSGAVNSACSAAGSGSTCSLAGSASANSPVAS